MRGKDCPWHAVFSAGSARRGERGYLIAYVGLAGWRARRRTPAGWAASTRSAWAICIHRLWAGTDGFSNRTSAVASWCEASEGVTLSLMNVQIDSHGLCGAAIPAAAIRPAAVPA